MRMFWIVPAVAGLTAIAALQSIPARAGDLPELQPSTSATSAWTGPYVGLGFGFGVGQVRQTYLGAPEQNLGVLGPSISIRAGYDHAVFPGLIVGAFGEATKSGERHRYFSALNEITGAIRQNYAWSVGGRIGMTPNPRQLWYVMGGYTLANYSLDILPEIAPASLPKNLDGVFIGLGVETLLVSGLSLGLDVRHTAFDAGVLHQRGAATWTERPNDVLTRIALNYRFGAHTAPVAATGHARDWQGFYVGGGGSYGTFTALYDRRPYADTETPGGNGGRGYMQAGYDFSIGANWIAGPFADYSLGRVTADERLRGRLENTAGFAAGVRVGWTFDQALLYATAGYSNHDLRVTNINAVVPALPGETRNVAAWFVGGGVETRLTRATSLKLEYRYADLGEQKFTLAAPVPEVTVRDGVDQSVRLGVSFRFGGE
jgi:outer membrane immunogenic protein